ncbi:helix-turn-helix transcriptional regulator [Corynebacterium urealyticum]|uniref:helix-turn-helix domain-containing protein n=1 Tax=Corynebacterium urealyticum TaxID=43771 RepID=UPI0011E66EA2|nr:transcriptional regulator [Corynebacterium urealyticum]TYR17542.1 helix-turn-helix transcriptional regulator [Corynebacterium urealyticum]
MSGNVEAGKMVRAARENLGMSQTALGAALGRTRQWVWRLETAVDPKAHWPVGLTPNLAAVLQISPRDLLNAAGIPEEDWPDLSNISSNGANLVVIESTGLSDHQIELLRSIAEEFRSRDLDHEGFYDVD